MSDDDYAGMAAETDDTPGRRSRGGKHKGPRFTWNSAYEQTFFRSLCGSLQLGLREGSTFKAEAWDRAAQALIDTHNAYPNKGHLINKSDNARKKFRLWRSLREDPDFLYNPTTKMVTATDDAWRRHIEKEPLSRSLKGRPFEHEEFYEVLFSDVMGTGGAPRRVMKPKRRGNDSVDDDMTGTGVMDLMGDTSAYGSTPQQQQTRTTLPIPAPSPVMPAPGPANSTSSTSKNNQNTAVPRPTAAVIPPRTSIASSSALTPPEETAPHSRKRFMPADATAVNSNGSSGSGHSDKRRRNDQVTAARAPSAVTPSSAVASAAAAGTSHDEGTAALAAVLRMAKAGGRPGWSEQALDLFFRDFGDEDMDLQLKIAEKALTDENKAMVFCKMPVALRRHWVKRLREVHNRST